MSPEHARAWIRVARDALLVLAGTSIVTVVLTLYIFRDEPPNFTLLGAAGVFFGVGAVLRADEWIARTRNGNGKTNGG